MGKRVNYKQYSQEGVKTLERMLKRRFIALTIAPIVRRTVRSHIFSCFLAALFVNISNDAWLLYEKSH